MPKGVGHSIEICGEISELLTKREVTCWLDICKVLLLRVNGPRWGQVSIGQYPAILTERTWSTKDLLHGFAGHFSSWAQQVVLRGQDSAILHSRVANPAHRRI